METAFNEWADCPVNLSRKEIDDAFVVIKDFFSADGLPGHLEALKQWRERITGKGYYTDANGNPSGLLFTHQLTLKLIETAQILRRPKLKDTLALLAFNRPEQIQEERNKLSYYPDKLSQDELINPALVLYAFFSNYSLASYRAHLYDWLTYALSSHPANEFIESNDLIAIYENIQRLYSAMWLIHNRNKSINFVKATFKEVKIDNPGRLYELDTELTTADRERLANVVSLIKRKLASAWAVIYLGRKPGKADYKFLLVLTANDEARDAASLSTMLEESCLPDKVVVLVHYASVVINAVDKENRFFCNALSRPVLYLSGNIVLPKTTQKSSAFKYEPHASNWERWHKQAVEFLSGAEYHLSVKAYSAALFSLHQCAEAILIAVVRTVLGYRINNHNLSRLLRITQMFTEDITAIFHLDSDEDKGVFSVLKDAYINIRYRDSYEPESEVTETLFSIVTELMKKAEQVHQQFLLISVL